MCEALDMISVIELTRDLLPRGMDVTCLQTVGRRRYTKHALTG